MTPLKEDTIAAISTPLGEGGIGIVRLSGPGTLILADKVFRGKDDLPPSRLPSHSLRYGHIIDDKKQPLDEVLLTVMRAPYTYTREDVVEINCHGGIVPLRKVLDLVLEKGARLAEPGEFTKRAFLNGRLDLAQAEAVAEIIKAKTVLGLRAAMSQLNGGLSRKVERARKKLTSLLVEVEAGIDFPEEEVNLLCSGDMLNRIEGVALELEQMLAWADKGTVLREGIKAVIGGRPNVGKSSLWNALLGEEKAIVTPWPGTTRDVLEEMVGVQGFPLRLLDTAGIRKTRGRIEKESVERSRRSMENADIILIVLDGSAGLTDEDKEILVELKEKTAILVINKIDLKRKLKKEDLETVLPDRRIVETSAFQGTGLEELKEAVADTFWRGEVPSPETLLVTGARHKQAVENALESLREASRGLSQEHPYEFIASCLRSAWNGLGELSGDTAPEEILEQIFSRFCIGK